LGAYRDGDLTARESLLVAGHLAACRRCSERADQLAHVDAILADVTPIEPSAGFTAAVMAKISALPAPAARRVRLWWLAALMLTEWAIIAVLNAAHVLHWERPLAAGTAIAGQLAVAAQTLYRVADHFHIGIWAGVGIAAEIIIAIPLAIALRNYLARGGAALRGAQFS